MEPANTLIASFGGPTKLSEALGVNRVTVQKWKASRAKGGTGGVIPAAHFERLTELATEQGVELDRNAFLPAELRSTPSRSEEAA